MYVDYLQLADFRSYRCVELPLQAGVTVFVGANGQGKTNLIEALDYLATLGSHRVSAEAPLVRAGCEKSLVRGRVRAGAEDDRAVQLEVEITPGRANRARLNRSPLARARDLLGILRTVLFSPEDLAIVKGDPADRRRFLDDLVVSRWPRLAGVRADYDRVLRQRSTLLKSMSGRGSRRGPTQGDAETTLAVWDEHLARHGSELLQARLETLAALVGPTAAAYADIAPTNNVAHAVYHSAVDLPEVAGDGRVDRAVLAERLTAAMQSRRAEEIQRGVCLVGPHRDDLQLALGELPAKGYASHGESWSFALALRLGSFAVLRADGIEPVLLLDDVFAELDVTRRERLATAVADAEQVLVTAAVAVDVPARLSGARYEVAEGTVRAVSPQPEQHGPGDG